MVGISVQKTAKMPDILPPVRAVEFLVSRRQRFCFFFLVISNDRDSWYHEQVTSMWFSISSYSAMSSSKSRRVSFDGLVGEHIVTVLD